MSHQGWEGIVVEVRDKNLNRIGTITPTFLTLELRDEVNNVGQWKLTLPAEHHLVATLKTPGSGIIVTGPGGVIMTGPTTKPEFTATPTDRQGSVIFEGVSDSVILADHLAFPQPSNSDPATQTVAYDERTGLVEDLMHAFVDANIGPSASVARKKANLTMGTNLHRGPTVTKALRFQTLGEALTELADNTNLGFRVVQVGSGLVFETYAYTDRTSLIRLDVNHGTLASSKVAYAPPGVTRAIVGGMGEDEDRLMGLVDTAGSIAAETEWGRRIERFIDAREIDFPADLAGAGTEVLAAEGVTRIGAQAVPIDGTTMTYGVDWFLGDKVTVVIDETEYSSVVNGVALRANTDGFDVGILFGDGAIFNPNAATTSLVANVASRVSSLERTVETDPTLAPRVTSAEAALSLLQNPPSCRAYSTTAVAIPNNGGVVTFNNERWDTDNMFSTVTNPSRITINVAGLYLVGGNVAWSASATGARGLWVRLNGTTPVCAQLVDIDSASTHYIEVSGVYKFAAGDYIELFAYQTTGVALSVTANGNFSPELWATRLGNG